MKREVYKWQVLALFWLVYFLNQADRQILFSVFPLVQGELGLTNTQLGLLGSSFQWVYGILVPAAGFLGDRLNRRNLIALALLGWSAATFSSGLAGGFALLLVFRALTGTGEAFYYPAAASIISDLHGQRTRSLAMSIHQTSLYCGIVSSGALAGHLGQKYGWRLAFLSFGALGVVVAFLVLRLLQEPPRGLADYLDQTLPEARPEARLTLKECLVQAFRTPTAIVLTVAFLGMNFAGVAFLTWMPTLLYQKFHYGLAAAGFHATSYHQLGAFLGVLAGGKIADHSARRARLSRPLVQMAGLLLATPFIYLAAEAGSALLAFASLGAFGVFRGLYDSNLFASLYEVVPPGARATATGLMLAIAFLLGGSSPLVIGNLSERIGLGHALASTSFWYLAAGLLILLDCVLWFRQDAARMRTGLFVQHQ